MAYTYTNQFGEVKGFPTQSALIAHALWRARFAKTGPVFITASGTIGNDIISIEELVSIDMQPAALRGAAGATPIFPVM